EGRQLAEAAVLTPRGPGEPHAARIRGGEVGRGRGGVRALVVYFEGGGAGRALDPDPGLGGRRLFKLVFRMGFFSADVHAGGRFVYSTSRCVVEGEDDRDSHPSRRRTERRGAADGVGGGRVEERAGRGEDGDVGGRAGGVDVEADEDGALEALGA